MATASIFDILTTQWVKDAFLAGVDLTDDNGNAFDDDVYESALRAAVSSTEQEFDLILDAIEVTGERHDLTDRDRGSYWSYYLHKRPVISVQKFIGKFGNQDVVEFPLGWVAVMDRLYGYLNIIAQGDGTTQSSPLFTPSLAIFRYDYIPGWFSFNYKAGFRAFTDTVAFSAGQTEKTVTFASTEQFEKSDYFAAFELVNPQAADAAIVPRMQGRLTTGMTIKLSAAPANALTVRWYVTDIPDTMRRIVGIRAAKTPLAIAGDLVMGAGVQSRSIGIDGLSQSMNTTKSPAGGAFAGRLKVLEMEEAQLIQSLQAAYGRTHFTGL